MQTTAIDSGVDNRTMLKALASWGYPPEVAWPYEVMRYRMRPSNAAYALAKPSHITAYHAVAQTETDMMGCLASGKPFLAGFTVYESFESPSVVASGVVPLPAAGEQVLGGHDVVVYGYDRTKGVWLFQNDWGASYGVAGRGTLPWAYLTNPALAGDFWAIDAVPGSAPAKAAPPLAGKAQRMVLYDPDGAEVSRWGLAEG